MDKSTIVWKEAKSHKKNRGPVAESIRSGPNDGPQRLSSHESDNLQEKFQEEEDDASDEWGEADENTEEPKSAKDVQYETNLPRPKNESSSSTERSFSHRRIRLKLIRNITALADSNHTSPEQDLCEETAPEIPFENWIEDALVAISPTADVIFFSGQSPERLVFLAKLRREPFDKYVTKTLNIPIDFDEYITSLLCIPIMSLQRTSLGSVDWTALVIGYSSGYVKFYTEQSTCLLSLKFCDEPVISLKLQTQKNNSNARSTTHFPSIVDELLISHKSCAIEVDGIGLHENLRISKEEVAKNGPSTFEPGYNLHNLPIILTCQRWKFVDTSGKVNNTELLGTRCTTRFDALRSDSINLEHIASKSCSRVLAVAGRDPFISCYSEAKNQPTHSYTEIISSLLPFWKKPQPTQYHINDVLGASELSMYDGSRLATNFIASPDKRLAVVTDNFGRVMLIDVTNWLIIRIWKGYRNAQCGWVEVKRNPEELGTPHASFLVIYAPKRGLLEVWSAQRGPRVVAFNVGKHCRLLYSGYKMLNTRAEAAALRASSGAPASGTVIDQSYHSNCYLLNAKKETVYLIELPYTYCLYKYGDLKSRDHLLIGELTAAINQDAEVSSISEILHRVVLAESQEICLNKIALGLTPVKILSLMENLMDNTMKNYDNQPGETLTDDDVSIMDLCKRIMRLCALFNDLQKGSQKNLDNISLPDVNHRLIEHYEEHPKEVDEFAERLCWFPTEVLRYLSLLTLEQSYKGKRQRKSSLYANDSLGGEPLSWFDFVSCFDLSRSINNQRTSRSQISKGKPLPQHSSDRICLRLKELNNRFLNDDKVIQTALSLFSILAENHHKSIMNSSCDTSANKPTVDLGDCYNYIEPSSRLALLFQFWLSTKLCDHWKMWVFLRDQVGRISDELKVAVLDRDGDDKPLIEAWKLIYQLILESDNIFAAIIATTVIKNDTLRMLSDQEKREKLERQNLDEDNSDNTKKLASLSSSDAIDWECLCIDAERMSLLNQQLEDVYLLSLLLNYSNADRRIIERVFVYRIRRISLANILRGGPTIVSELIAQWVAQPGRNDDIDLTIFTEDYGLQSDFEEQLKGRIVVSGGSKQQTSGLMTGRQLKFLPRLSMLSANNEGDEQIKELLHHVKTSFPYSLDRDKILLHCVWEFCQSWTSSTLQSDRKSLFLQRAIDALSLLSCQPLKHDAASLTFKTFFQRTFERLTLLIETNPTLLSPKCSRSRDALARRELNMNEDSLEDFIRFCFSLSEFLLQTFKDDDQAVDSPNSNLAGERAQSHYNIIKQDNDDRSQQRQLLLDEKQLRIREELSERLLSEDELWSTPAKDGYSIRDEIDCNRDNVDLQSKSNCSNFSQTNVMLLSTSSSSNYYIPTTSERIGIGTASEADHELSSIKHFSIGINTSGAAALVQTILSAENLFPIAVLIELNRLGSLMDLIFKLKIIKSYPLTLIGEEARRLLKFDLQQSPTTGTEIQLRSGSLLELRQKFARRCILNIVTRLSEETPFSEFEDIDSTQHIESSVAASRDREKKRLTSSTNNLFIRHSRHRRDTTSKKSQPVAASGEERRSEIDEEATRSPQFDSEGYTNRDLEQIQLEANNECMQLFSNLLSLADDWQLACDEIELEFVFELFRCNHDKLARQLIVRIQDKQMLASGLLKICSQRILVLFGLSSRGGLSSTDQWRQRSDKWSLFQPSVSSWLKSIQEQELHQELAELNFSLFGSDLKPGKQTETTTSCDEDNDSDNEAFIAYIEHALGLRISVLKALHARTKSILELITNYLDGQASRLAYDLLQLLELQLFEKQLLPNERKLWVEQKQKSLRQKSKKSSDIE